MNDTSLNESLSSVNFKDSSKLAKILEYFENHNITGEIKDIDKDKDKEKEEDYKKNIDELLNI